MKFLNHTYTGNQSEATQGFKKTGLDDTHFLLAGGGSTPTNLWATNVQLGNYLPTSGGNITGGLTIQGDTVATQSWVTSQGYLTSASLNNYVTTNTPQSITGDKTFQGALKTETGRVLFYDDPNSTWGKIQLSDNEWLFENGGNLFARFLPGGSLLLHKALAISAEINPQNLTANRLYNLPNASGTIALQEWVTSQGYTHPTTSGNKHIPAGGASGQILRWSADGTAVWGADNNTTYSAGTGLTLTTTTFSVKYGTTAGTAAQGNDSRINNGQTAFNWGNHAGLYASSTHTHSGYLNQGLNIDVSAESNILRINPIEIFIDGTTSKNFDGSRNKHRLVYIMLSDGASSLNLENLQPKQRIVIFNLTGTTISIKEDIASSSYSLPGGRKVSVYKIQNSYYSANSAIFYDMTGLTIW